MSSFRLISVGTSSLTPNACCISATERPWSARIVCRSFMISSVSFTFCSHDFCSSSSSAWSCCCCCCFPAAFAASISLLSSAISACVLSLFTFTGQTIRFAASAYRSVLSVSSKLMSAGLTVASITDTALPPSDSRSSHVSTESRYGTTAAGFFAAAPPAAALPAAGDLAGVFAGAAFAVGGGDSRWASALMQRPSVASDLLMLTPSSIRAPDVPAAPERSDPARSTRLMIDLREFAALAAARGTCTSSRMKSACERLLCAFIFVAAVWRVAFPDSISEAIVSYESTAAFLSPST